MIEIRPLRDHEVDVYVALRNRVHPETPVIRETVLDDRAQRGHLDLLALAGGEPVGVASTEPYMGAPNGDLAYISLRVLHEHRRRGIGTELHRRASEHARALGKARFYCVFRSDDADSARYYGALGYEEVSRMQDVYLDLADEVAPAPDGELEIVPITPELEPAVYAVAVEAEADIPSGEAHESGTFDQWHAHHFGSAVVLADLSFAALDGGRVVGYSIVGLHEPGIVGNWITGVAREARGRGVALALKRHQAAAARAAGWKGIRAQNDLGNAPMRRVNDRLGFRPLFEWVHLTGPPIA